MGKDGQTTKKWWGMSMGYGNDEVNDMIIMGDNREQQGKNKGWWKTICYHDTYKQEKLGGNGWTIEDDTCLMRGN
jgi:hypothetical protein